MTAGVVPHGWAVSQLPHLVAPGGLFVDGDWVESKDQDAEGAIRLTQLADVGDGEWRNRSSRFLTTEKARELRCTILKKGDVLVARMPDPLGRSCLFPGDSQDCVTVVDVCIVRTAHDGVSARWLSHFINAPQFRSAIHRLQSGSTRKRISRKNLGTIKLLIPPTNEQHRLADTIESYFTRLDDAVATLERVRRNLKRYRASVLKAAVEGRLVPTEAELARAEGRSYEPASVLLTRILAERRRRWEEAELAKLTARGKPPNDDKWKAKYVEPVAPDTSELPELPEGWCWATLDSFLVNIEAGKNFKCDERPPEADEVGVVKVSAVTWGTFDEDESKTCRRGDQFRTEYLIGPGDFLISRANTIELVGACVLVGTVRRRLMLSDKILRLQLVEPWAGWLLWALRSRWGRDEIERFATGNQESMRNISQASMRGIRVPLPPANEADRILGAIDTALEMADNVVRSTEGNTTRLTRLRQSILKWAFEGRLVDQDPTDEPASVLLERIRAEREAATRGAMDKRRRIRENAAR